MSTSPYQIRELEVTDIRCRAEGCGAGPGVVCKNADGTNRMAIHYERRDEFDALKAAGWRWQEPDLLDRGEPRKP